MPMASLTAPYSPDRCVDVCSGVLVVCRVVLFVSCVCVCDLFSSLQTRVKPNLSPNWPFSLLLHRLVIEPPDSYGVEHWYGLTRQTGMRRETGRAHKHTTRTTPPNTRQEQHPNDHTKNHPSPPPSQTGDRASRFIRRRALVRRLRRLPSRRAANPSCGCLWCCSCSGLCSVRG